MVEGRIWRDFNFFLFGCVLALLCLSLLSVYSATLNAVTAFGNPMHVLFPRHVVNIVVGLIGLTAMTMIDYRLLSSFALPLYVAVILTLSVVLVFGRIQEGAQSWFDLGVRTVQPSEFCKVAMIVVLASYWSRFEKLRHTWQVQLGGLVIGCLPVLLVLVQPDFGTAVIFGAIWLSMAWCSGIRLSHLLMLFLVAIPIIWVGWTYVLDDYQKARLLTFYWLHYDPTKVDPNDGYNVTQSLIAIGSGGMFGAGLTHGLLSQGNYVPVQYSDFIFAVIGEEMGFAGGIILILFFFLLLFLTISIARRARDLFGHLIAIGIFGMLFAHFAVNVGMTIGVFPVTGIPLPFVSYGGSFTFTSLLAVGLLQSIAMRWRRIVF
ncbi:MAG: rod shape-determining protein RodA [Chloroflexaceae bacterium]|nr:rod shape-determining protein RodA [Chloroflexaceae bacterium]